MIPSDEIHNANYSLLTVIADDGSCYVNILFLNENIGQVYEMTLLKA